MPAATASFRNVELAKVGEWKASTGQVTLTTEDLAAMVDASRDPEIDAAPMKTGHTGALAELGDSAPALGWARNLRLSDDGTTLIGDLEDIPAALAEIIPKAFARRSIEYMPKTTPSGKTYRQALHAVALLGVQDPAVKGMADIAELYKMPAAASAEPTTGTVVALSIDDDAMQSRALHPAATNDGPNTSTNPTGGRMPELDPKKLREALGLAEDASDLDVLAAMPEGIVAPPAPAAAPAAVTPPAPAAEPVAASAAAADPQVVHLSAGQYDELKALAAQGSEAMKILRAQQIDNVVATALSAGKFTPAEAPAFKARLEEDFDGTSQLINALAAGKVPTTETGIPGTAHPNQLAAHDATWEAWEKQVFGDELTRAKEA